MGKQSAAWVEVETTVVAFPQCVMPVCVVRRARRASTMTSVSVFRESHELHRIKTKLTLARARLLAPPHPAAITV